MGQEVGQAVMLSTTHHESPSGDQIAQRAYEIYEREGRPPGKDREHWHRAEMELLAELHARRQVNSDAGLTKAEEPAGSSAGLRSRRRGSIAAITTSTKPVITQARSASAGDSRRRRTKAN